MKSEYYMIEYLNPKNDKNVELLFEACRKQIDKMRAEIGATHTSYHFTNPYPGDYWFGDRQQRYFYAMAKKESGIEKDLAKDKIERNNKIWKMIDVYEDSIDKIYLFVGKKEFYHVTLNTYYQIKSIDYDKGTVECVDSNGNEKHFSIFYILGNNLVVYKENHEIRR